VDDSFGDASSAPAGDVARVPGHARDDAEEVDGTIAYASRGLDARAAASDA
jgi:hypothetical protein